MYGLNEKVGNISFYDSSGQSDYNFQKPYSEKTGQLIDEEVSKMVEEAYTRTKNILKDHKEQLTKLAELLLEKEVIFKDDLEKIFGKRAYNDKSRSDELLEENLKQEKKNGSAKKPTVVSSEQKEEDSKKEEEETKATDDKES